MSNQSPGASDGNSLIWKALAKNDGASWAVNIAVVETACSEIEIGPRVCIGSHSQPARACGKRQASKRLSG
jgi:hypothetical protein